MVRESNYAPWTATSSIGSKEIPRKDFLAQFTYWSWIIIGIAALLQCAFFGSLANAIAAGCVVLAWFIVTNTVLRPKIIKNFPLSSFLICGFTATQLCLPLLFTLLENKPLIYNINYPYEVFLHSFLALLVLVVSHVFYCYIIRKGKSVSYSNSNILFKAGLFNPPTDLQVWLIGLIGMLSMLYVYLYIPSSGRASSGAFEKAIQGLAPFTYAPFFIPFSQLYGRKSHHNNKGLAAKLLCFGVALFVISMGANTRATFMLGFTSLGYSFGLGLLLGIIRTRLFTIKNAALCLVSLWLLIGPLSDIGTAMVMVRSLRADTPRNELVELTWDTFKDKKALQAYKSSAENTNPWGDSWDETYLDNIFLARFCNIKFNDINLGLAAKIGQNDADIRQYSVDRITVMLPQPLLKALNIDVDKDAVNAIAFGDLMHYKVYNNAEVFGSLLTGHFAGTGMAAFGWWYLLILGVAMLPVYELCDLLTNKIVKVGKCKNKIVFSFCGLLSITSIFQFLPTESVIGVITFLLRGWIQLVIIYVVLFHLTRPISRMIALFTTMPKASFRH